jgi:hypothetical protein
MYCFPQTSRNQSNAKQTKPDFQGVGSMDVSHTDEREEGEISDYDGLS